MAFKLRSGNKTPFKAMGEKKETVDQYNARVKAQYDSEMQSYNDSTTAHNNRLEYLEKFNQADKISEGVEYAADGTRGHIYSDPSIPRVNNTTAINPELDKDMDYTTDADGNRTAEFISARRNLTAEEIAHNEEADRKFAESSAKNEEGFKIFEKNIDSGIYSSSGRKNPNDLRPKVLPKEPTLKIETKKLDLKPIEIKETTEPQLKKSKRKYMTSKDGKTKTNLETGEVTKVKIAKVKKRNRPNKRKVKNLVTGKNNKIQ